MAGYLPWMFTRGKEGLGSLFGEIEKRFDDFSRRSPLAGFSGFGEGGAAPKIDVSESKDGIDGTAEIPGGDEKGIHFSLSNCVSTIPRAKKTPRDETDKDSKSHMTGGRDASCS